MSGTRNFEICQQVEYLKNKSIDSIKEILDSSDSIEKYAYILHDKDTNLETGKPKPAHYHVMVKLTSPRQWSTVYKLFEEIPDQYINKIKGRWADALDYLTHHNAPEKYQYDAEDVVSNFDWEEESKLSTFNTKEIIDKILSGEIRRYNYTEFIPGELYIKYKRQFETAFDYRADSIRGVERNMKCIYISGGSGTGKTTYAKAIAAKQNYSIFVSSGSNDPLDGYAGQDCIILDDLRPSCMGLSDLLKMLDNNTSSTIKSRYKNKMLECKLIIITTTLDIEKFFRNVFSEEPETSIQLKRRCQLMVKFPKDINGKVKMYCYNQEDDIYDLIGEQENPIPKIIKQEEMDRKRAIALLSL